MYKNQAMGLLFPNMGDGTLRELTEKRSVGSTPFGGRYRLIDFALSNMVNAGIGKVGVITKKNYTSLMDHLGSGKAWDLSRKNEGLYYLPPRGSDELYEGRIASLADIQVFLQNSKEEIVVLSDCYTVCNMDLDKMIAAHTQSDADVTVGFVRDTQHAATGQMLLWQDDSGRVTDIIFNQSETATGCFGVGLFIMNKAYLLQMVKDAVGRNLMHFERDVLQRHVRDIVVRGYEITEYAMVIRSPERYFAANMALLQPSVREALFMTGRPIYTKVRDCSPAKYGLHSAVSNSLIGDGSIVNGTVRNAIIFRDVDIGRDAVVENCVIMQGAAIGANTTLRYIITDKNVTVKNGRTLQGVESYPVYIEKGTIV